MMKNKENETVRENKSTTNIEIVYKTKKTQNK